MIIKESISGDCITIQQPTDIHPLLNWCRDKMIDNRTKTKIAINIRKWDNAINYISEMLKQIEADGFSPSSDKTKKFK